MVASTMNILSKLIEIKEIAIAEENIVGIKLPVLRTIIFYPIDYVYFNTPQWFERLITVLTEKIELQLRLQIAMERQRRLAKSIQTVTQRKNLFEKILIPKALNNIRLIQIFWPIMSVQQWFARKLLKRKGYYDEHRNLRKSECFGTESMQGRYFKCVTRIRLHAFNCY